MEAQESKMMNDFQTRVHPLVEQLMEILERAETGISAAPSLLEYARILEMIQKSSRTLGQAYYPDPKHLVHRIYDYSAVCKAIALQIADVQDNETLYEVSVALLLDATEVLAEIIKALKAPPVEALTPTVLPKIDTFLNSKLVERVKWASYQFQSQGRAKRAEGEEKMEQSEIDSLLKKLGVA